jgi:hypothetical protein
MPLATVVTRGYGNGTFDGAIREVVTRGFLGPLAPTLVVSIPQVSLPFNVGPRTFPTAPYFVGQLTYAIAPAVPAGWSFDTGTGVLTALTDTKGRFGSYVVTASNSAGDTASNAFFVVVGLIVSGRGVGRLNLGLGM